MMALEFPRISKCCCCISLRTGSLIIGYISLLVSSMFMAAVSWSLQKVINFVHTNEGKPHLEHTPEDIARIALGVYISHAYLLMVLLYYFIISFLLVIGTHLNKIKYLRYYFKAGVFLLALALALVVVTTIFLGLVATVPVLKWSLILFYCLIVVRSTVLEMEEQNKPRVFEMHTLYNTHQAPLMA